MPSRLWTRQHNPACGPRPSNAELPVSPDAVTDRRCGRLIRSLHGVASLVGDQNEIALPGEVLHEGQLGVRAVGVETHCPDVVASDSGDGIEDILGGARVGAGDEATRTAVPMLGEGGEGAGGSGGSAGPNVGSRKSGRSLEGVVARGAEAVGLHPRRPIPAEGQREGAVVTDTPAVVVPVRAHGPDIVSG